MSLGRWTHIGSQFLAVVHSGLPGLLIGWITTAAWSATDIPCQPYVQAQPAWHTATFRPHTDAFLQCPVSEATYREVVSRWLRQRRPDEAVLTSLGLGRLVDYPWLSEQLARAALDHPDWNARTGRSRGMHVNRLVADILSGPVIRERLEAPFAGLGYEMVSVSVEKVLVGTLGGTVPDAARPTSRVPYDAMVWLRLARRER